MTDPYLPGVDGLRRRLDDARTAGDGTSIAEASADLGLALSSGTVPDWSAPDGQPPWAVGAGDEAVDLLGRALLRPGVDGVVHIRARLGRLLTARFLTGGRAAADREAAIAVLTDVITADAAPADERAAAHLALARVLTATLLPADLLQLCQETADAAPDVTLLSAAMTLAPAAPGLRERAAAARAHLRAAADSGVLTESDRRTAEAELTLLTLLLPGAAGATAAGESAAVATAVGRLRELSAEPSLVATGSGRLRHVAGFGGLLLHELTGDGDLLERAIADLEDSYVTQPAGAGLASTGRLLRNLRRAYRHRARPPEDLQAATDAGLAALTEDIGVVLLRDGAVAALRPALAVGAVAHDLALDSLAEEDPEAAMAALEMGRGLVSHAATATTGLPELLDSEGFRGLSAEWRALGRHQPDGLPVPAEAAALLRAIRTDVAGTPTALRLRTLRALTDTAPGQALLSPCDADAVAGGLRSTGRDALIYLLCGDADRPGWALIVTAAGALRSVELPALRIGRGGPLDAFAGAAAAGRGPADPAAVEEMSRWAGLCVVGPVLARLPVEDARLTLVPCGPLAAVPWAAAVVHTAEGSGVRACQLAAWSYAATGRQAIDLAHRQPPPTRLVFLPEAGPDTRWAGPDLDAVRALWQPEQPTPEEVLRFLPGGREPASLLHIGAHVVTADPPLASHLALAGPDGRLDLARMLIHRRHPSVAGRGGLVVLSTCRSAEAGLAHDPAVTVGNVFLAAGAAGVIAQLWSLSDRRRSHLFHQLHERLRAGDPPDLALRAAQLWMLDPHRAFPDDLPEVPGLADPAAWAAYIYHG